MLRTISKSSITLLYTKYNASPITPEMRYVQLPISQHECKRVAIESVLHENRKKEILSISFSQLIAFCLKALCLHASRHPPQYNTAQPKGRALTKQIMTALNSLEYDERHGVGRKLNANDDTPVQP